MTTQTAIIVSKNLDVPYEVREIGNGKMESVHLEGNVLARITLKPGWRWSKDMKPSMRTNLCQAHHLQYVISGRLVVRMEDGTEFDLRPGDCVSIAPGHDAWVVGNEPFVAIDFTGLKDYRSEYVP